MRTRIRAITEPQLGELLGKPTLFTNWMEIVEADEVALPEPSGHAVTWVND